MNLQEFKNKYLGKQVEYHSYDPAAKYQCVSIIKVGVRKLTIKFHSSRIISSLSFFKSMKISNIKIFSAMHNSRAVGLFERSIGYLMNPFMPVSGMIKAVLLMSSKAKILFSIIKRVSVDMVNLHIIGAIHNYSVHMKPALFSISRLISEMFSPSSSSVKKQPLVLIQALVISIINNCKPISGKRDLFHNSNYITSTHI